MFGGKKMQGSASGVETIIGRSAKFTGELVDQGSLRIDGGFSGTIRSAGDLYIGADAEITATITAVNATIAGRVNGDMFVSGKLELLSTASLYGDIKAGVLSIEEGATFRGVSDSYSEELKPAVTVNG